MYVTSSDAHDVHDVLMITYIGAWPQMLHCYKAYNAFVHVRTACNLPWMLGGISLTPTTNPRALLRRFVHICLCLYFFIYILLPAES